jgi:1,4-alpha-glucan branching enzyme
MYWSMAKDKESLVIDRGLALHKMLRLLTMTLGGDGYLTFMGNEFGHPEWIDFPREGNNWSYHYCRRQWSLADNPMLRYGQLNAFEKAMVAFGKKSRLFASKDRQLLVDNLGKRLAYQRGKGIYVFNFHPTYSQEGSFVPMPEAGSYKVVMSTDDFCFGGMGRIYHQQYDTTEENGVPGIRLYLPCRTAVILEKVK